MSSARSIFSAESATAVTPNDSTFLQPTKAIYVGGAGDLAVVMADGGSAVTLSGVTAGSILPINVSKVMSTNTTATLIVALR